MFTSLGVIVDGGLVYRRGFGGKGTVLRPLAGAEAGVTDGTSRHTLTRVLTVAGHSPRSMTPWPTSLLETVPCTGSSWPHRGRSGGRRATRLRSTHWRAPLAVSLSRRDLSP